MSVQKYFGDWDSVAAVEADFLNYGESEVKDGVRTFKKRVEGFPTDAEIVIASYTTPSYEGYATVVYERDGKLWEVNGSHCSCYGLEGQWGAEETTREALGMRKFRSYDGHEDSFEARWKELFHKFTPEAKQK